MNSENSKSDRYLAYHVRGTFRAYETALNRYLMKIDLPLSHFHVLRLAWDNKGSNQKYISENSFMTESVVSQVIKAMTKDGLVKRKMCPDDARKRVIHLTPKGNKIRTKALAAGLAIVEGSYDGLSKATIEETISILITLRENLEKGMES